MKKIAVGVMSLVIGVSSLMTGCGQMSDDDYKAFANKNLTQLMDQATASVTDIKSVIATAQSGDPTATNRVLNDFNTMQSKVKTTLDAFNKANPPSDQKSNNDLIIEALTQFNKGLGDVVNGLTNNDNALYQQGQTECNRFDEIMSQTPYSQDVITNLFN